jgi:hypothetical protein
MIRFWRSTGLNPPPGYEAHDVSEAVMCFFFAMMVYDIPPCSK